MTDQIPNGDSLRPLGAPSPMGSVPPPRPPAPPNIDVHADRRVHFLGAVACIAALASVAIAAGAAVTIAASHEISSMPPATPATAALVEDGDCDQDDDLSGARPDTTVGQPGTQRLTVTVPAIAVITYDRAGHVTSVMTNTGCAPRSDNQIWQTGIDNVLTEGTWEDIEHLDFVGDFTQAGTHVSQQPAPH